MNTSNYLNWTILTNTSLPTKNHQPIVQKISVFNLQSCCTDICRNWQLHLILLSMNCRNNWISLSPCYSMRQIAVLKTLLVKLSFDASLLKLLFAMNRKYETFQKETKNSNSLLYHWVVKESLWFPSLLFFLSIWKCFSVRFFDSYMQKFFSAIFGMIDLISILSVAEEKVFLYFLALFF